MFKKFFSFFLIFSLFLPVFAQSPSVRLGVLKGISCVPCAYLIENKEKLAVQNMNFQIFDSAQSELPRLLRGEIDLCFLSVENAAKVFNKKPDSIVALGIVQSGSLFLFTNDENFASLEDLRGKSVLVSGANALDERIFSYILSKKGISASQNANSSGTDENSVRLDFSVPTAEIANNLILKKSEFAVLGEPYATVAAKNSSQIRRVENLSKIYSELDGDFLTSPAILLVANAKFVSKNKNLVNQFIEVYRQATDWTKKNPEKAALLAEKHNLGVKSQIARISIPNAALTFRNALSGKAEIEKILSLFLDSKPETVGGSLPADEFYFR